MAEIPDRVPGGIILASYSNDIRDRAAMRYADPTARDASNPLPQAGELAYVASLAQLQVFDGTLWQGLLDIQDEAAIDDRLDVLEQWVIDPFNGGSFGFTGVGILETGSITIPAGGDGDWLMEFDSLMFFADTSSVLRSQHSILKNGFIEERWILQSQAAVSNVEDWSIPFAVRYPFAGLVAGDVITFEQQMTTVGSNGSVSNIFFTGKHLPDGTL